MSIAGKVVGYLGAVFNLFPRSGGGVVVRQPGGTPGTDEVQINHSGTATLIKSMDGPLNLQSAGDYVQLGGGTTFGVMTSHELQTQGGSLTGYGAQSKYGTAAVAQAGVTAVGAGVLKVTDGSTGLGSLVSDLLVARQDGGVAGTDEVQITHDGTNGLIRAMDGKLQIRAAGSDPGIEILAPSGAVMQRMGGTSGNLDTYSIRMASADIGTLNTGFVPIAAGQVKVTDGSTGNGALVLGEITEPANPAADLGVLFLVDNGSGKSVLKVRFASGASQTIATEP